MYKYFKRLIDFILCLFGLIFLLPLLLFISIWIKVDSPGPILFKQKRFGINKTHFYILKFRTMRVDSPKDKPTHLLEDPYKWITNSGKFLRKTSLDELPQLINIIKGEMSIVGPRPALWNQYDLIEFRDRYNANSIPVGLTGLAQVKGRDELDITSKAELDGYYAANASFELDLLCIFLTFYNVLKGKGITEGKHV